MRWSKAVSQHNPCCFTTWYCYCLFFQWTCWINLLTVFLHTHSYSIQNIKCHIPVNFTRFDEVEWLRFQKRPSNVHKKYWEDINEMSNTDNTKSIWDYHYTELKQSLPNYSHLVMTIIHSCIQWKGWTQKNPKHHKRTSGLKFVFLSNILKYKNVICPTDWVRVTTQHRTAPPPITSSQHWPSVLLWLPKLGECVESFFIFVCQHLVCVCGSVSSK